MTNAANDNVRPAHLLAIGETWENECARVHCYRDVLVFTDLTNAGKRGKKCIEICVSTDHPEAAAAVLIPRLEQNGVATVLDIAELAEKREACSLSLRERRSIDTAPAGQGAEKFTVGDLEVHLDWDSFSFVDKKGGRHKDGSWFAYDRSVFGNGRIAAKKVRAWVSESAEFLQQAGYSELISAMNQLDVRFSTQC